MYSNRGGPLKFLPLTIYELKPISIKNLIKISTVICTYLVKKRAGHTNRYTRDTHNYTTVHHLARCFCVPNDLHLLSYAVPSLRKWVSLPFIPCSFFLLKDHVVGVFVSRRN